MDKAIIFDMNGVIVDDEKFHQQAWIEYCKRHGFSLTESEIKNKFTGRTARENFNYLYKRTITEDELDEYANERIEIVLELEKGKLKLVEGLQELLDALLYNQIKTAVATSARTSYFNFIMDTFNLKKYFTVTLTEKDVKKSKPDPEIYLKAAELLRVQPVNCIVFEDSISGIKAGKAAGMKVIAIATTHTKGELTMADKVINNFKEISVKDLM